MFWEPLIWENAEAEKPKHASTNVVVTVGKYSIILDIQKHFIDWLNHVDLCTVCGCIKRQFSDQSSFIVVSPMIDSKSSV